MVKPAPLVPDGSGGLTEQGDRWQKSVVLCGLAVAAFANAERVMAELV
jgi:hypothetical protein